MQIKILGFKELVYGNLFEIRSWWKALWIIVEHLGDEQVSPGLNQA